MIKFIHRVPFSLVCLILIVLLNNTTVQAQTEKKLIKEAETALSKGDKKNALNFYLKALEKNPDNADANYRVGLLYLSSVYSHRALTYIEKAYSINPKIDKEVHWNLAFAYHLNLKFDEAIQHYEEHKKVAGKEDHNVHKVERRIYECNNGKEFLASPLDVKIENVGGVINTQYPDFAPVISADESIMIFTSRREGSTGLLLDDNGEYYEDIYISNKVNGEWGPPQNIGTNINTESHDASIGLSADGKELFMYKDEGGGDIYYCKLKKDGTWSKPLPFEGDINTRKSYENAAAISPDGNRLFFTSNRDGGFGDLDLYMSEIDGKGNWGKPVNLGPKVNTEAGEEGPFMDLDGKTLYFSSRLHKGMGGYDLFKTVYDEKTKSWSEPVNLGYPINSADDDLYFVLSGDGKHAYFASVKEEGMGEKDIYMMTMPPREDYQELITKMEAMNLKTVEKQEKIEVVPEKVEMKPVVLKGVVKEAVTGIMLSASISLLDENGNAINSNSGESYNFDVTSSNPKQYTISVEKEGYGFTSKNVSVPVQGAELIELVNNFTLKKLEIGATFALRNIYYDFDKASLKPKSITELNKLLKLMQEKPTMRIEIGSHTDNYGSNEYNRALSQRRAQSVVNWLISKGISKDRITAKGYGEERPIASNDDEIEGRELNRRTEFTILK